MKESEGKFHFLTRVKSERRRKWNYELKHANPKAEDRGAARSENLLQKKEEEEDEQEEEEICRGKRM